MIMRGEYWWVYWRPECLQWAHFVEANSIPVARGQCRDWADFPAPAGARLFVSVAGERIRIHRVDLPTSNRRRFMAALPFALEDKLLRDPEAYHLAPLAMAKRGTFTSVAIMEHEHIQALLEELNEKDWHAKALVPDFLLLPRPEPGKWLLDAASSPFLLRMSDEEGGAAINEQLTSEPPGPLLLALEDAQNLPASIQVRVANKEQFELVSKWQSRLELFEVSLNIFEEKSERSEYLTCQIQQKMTLNLLTDPYAVKNNNSFSARRLIPAATLVAGLLAVIMVNWFVQTAQIKSEHERLVSSIEATYREAFPDARNLVDPRYQMERRLEALRSNGQNNDDQADFLNWLEQLAPILIVGKDYQLQTLSFDGSDLVMEISVPDYQALEELQKQLTQSAIVEMDNAELENDRVFGRLVMRRRA